MVSITPDVEHHIRSNTQWQKLPPSVKASLGNAPGLYDKAVVDYSVKNQLRWRNSLVRHIKKDERKYYESLLQYSRENLMLYPYHLQDMLIQGLRVTAFVYYSNMMFDLMCNEKSYDSLPNFTAADCLRLMGIGRNQYIDLMNQYRSKKFFRRRGIRDMLPAHPVKISRVEPWWMVNVGYVTEDDIRLCSPEEHKTIDKIIDSGKVQAGSVQRQTILKLYNRGLIYFEIPIADADIIVVPPLQGFVMNRVQGDYFETLLYKIFVSIDEHTSVGELANVLQIDVNLIKNAISVFIRLGFAHKKSQDASKSEFDASWTNNGTVSPTSPQPYLPPLTLSEDTPGIIIADDHKTPVAPGTPDALESSQSILSVGSGGGSGTFQKRLGFLFDSALTAFLMMGNLSPGLKNHAVTMFEVGKLTDESMDSFLVELGKVTEQIEGEARRYYEHAITLRNTLKFLRHNPLLVGNGTGGCGLGVDLLRLESMASLDPGTLRRILQKNYSILVSMAPLSQEVQLLSSCSPPHLGPAIAEMNSIWFKLWLYVKLGCGPISLLLAKGTRLRTLPKLIRGYTRVLVTTWGHDPTSVFVSNLLLTVNDALTHSSVLIQAHGWRENGEVKSIPFPFDRERTDTSSPKETDDLLHHPCLQVLEKEIDIQHTCGYVNLLRTGAPPQPQGAASNAGQSSASSRRIKQPTAEEKAKQSEISDFLEDLKELGLDEPKVTPAATEQTSSAQEEAGLQKQNGTGTVAVSGSHSNDTVVGEGGTTRAEGSDHSLYSEGSMTPSQKKMFEEWVPLELSFGIPLFSDSANRPVCDKIVEFGLFKAENLELQTQANRLLALDLLKFISCYQDVPYFSDGHDPSHFTDSMANPPPVPMPTRNLLFYNGKLTNFNGR